jgi:hypothetical protein
MNRKRFISQKSLPVSIFYCLLLVMAFGSRGVLAFELPGISPSGFGFENDVTIKWRNNGNKAKNVSRANRADGVLFIDEEMSYLVKNLKFTLKAKFDTSKELGDEGYFIRGLMAISGVLLDDSGTKVARGTLFKADLLDFNYSDGLFGYNTEITACKSIFAEYCTTFESVYTQLDGTVWDLGIKQRVVGDGFAVTTIPVPAAFWLFGSGLIGLALITKRNKTAM